MLVNVSHLKKTSSISKAQYDIKSTELDVRGGGGGGGDKESNREKRRRGADKRARAWQR